MPLRTRWRTALATAWAAAALSPWPAQAQAPAVAQPAGPGAAAAAVIPSAMDEELFFEVLTAEMELRNGSASNAFAWMMRAANRTREEQLFQRAAEIALQARAGDQALQAARLWRQAHPGSMAALQLQIQVLSALNRVPELAEPLRSLLQRTSEAERGGLIAAIPRFLQRAPDRKQAAQLVDDVLQTYRDQPATRVMVLVASGRAWAAADDADRALTLARAAHAADASAPGPVLLALELMPQRPAAEDIVKSRLAAPGVDPVVRLAYARSLTTAQRYVDAVAQLHQVTQERPDMAQPWLTLGALQVELRHPQEAEAALQRYVALMNEGGAAAAATATTDDDGDDEADARPAQRLVQAWLLLAQAAELRRDYTAAEGWLARIQDPRRALEVQTRRATLMARQGRLAEAREAVRNTPEREPGDARAKLVAEAGVLREARQWRDAYDVLGDASARFPGDPDLLYEQAMVAEKLGSLDDMERLLRRVISLKPDNAHAHNALGYSLADRSQRLPEARSLIQRALALAPGDPFITDSLGWVEYRLGNLPEALRLLRQAYAARPDVEIGAHLGEVLWAAGQRDEARRIWAESRGRDASNDVLRETLARLKVDL